MLIEDGVYWMVYHAYDAQIVGVPKLRIESIAWDAEGWPSLPSGNSTTRYSTGPIMFNPSLM